ncbi:hypothetical protein C4564_04930 [Candidatus Microgenomates bacterium]|nr:MAG: hypothetical protein C4564_04930 [Candidatus Microgenomates bacterium]
MNVSILTEVFLKTVAWVYSRAGYIPRLLSFILFSTLREIEMITKARIRALKAWFNIDKNKLGWPEYAAWVTMTGPILVDTIEQLGYFGLMLLIIAPTVLAALLIPLFVNLGDPSFVGAILYILAWFPVAMPIRLAMYLFIVCGSKAIRAIISRIRLTAQNWWENLPEDRYDKPKNQLEEVSGSEPVSLLDLLEDSEKAKRH